MSRQPEEQVEVNNIERNPYSTTLPADPYELGLALDEQQKIHREQHNKTQAGDTTFDYGLLLRVYPAREFTLGSLGRFFHPDFGLIEARFCRLSRFLESDFQAQPVGKLKSSKTGVVGWEVTNDLSLSGQDLAAGLVFFSSDPADGSYGWVVVRGPNPLRVQLDSTSNLTRGVPFGWVANSRLGLTFTGPELGRGAGNYHTVSQIPAGAMFIDFERWSEAGLLALIDDATVAIQQHLAELDSKYDGLSDRYAAQQQSLTQLGVDLVELRERIKREELTRQQQIEALNNQLAPYDWQTVISDSASLLRSEYQAADNELRQLISQLTGVPPFDPTGLQAQIDAVYTIISAIQRDSSPLPYPTAAGQIIQAVEIPPDPGSETPTSSFEWQLSTLPLLAIDDLTDVDTTGKVNGSSLVWNLALGMWVPGPIPIADAPNNTNYYSRRGAAWVAFTPFPEAPTDGQYYTRRNSTWIVQPAQAMIENPTYTVTGAPAAGAAGSQIYVTNPSAGQPRPYWSDGTDWRDATGTVLA